MNESEKEAFSRACDFTIPLGKYKGDRLGRIGANDDGLKYLDWLVGQSWVDGPLRSALDTYLGHPAISRRVDEITD